MSKRRNGKIMRILALDELDIPRDSPEYKATWARIDRKIDRLPDEIYRGFDEQIEDMRKEMKLFIKYNM